MFSILSRSILRKQKKKWQVLESLERSEGRCRPSGSWEAKDAVRAYIRNVHLLLVSQLQNHIFLLKKMQVFTTTLMSLRSAASFLKWESLWASKTELAESEPGWGCFGQTKTENAKINNKNNQILPPNSLYILKKTLQKLNMVIKEGGTLHWQDFLSSRMQKIITEVVKNNWSKKVKLLFLHT